jgi:hypothetical protein
MAMMNPFAPLDRLCLFSGKVQGPRGQQTFAVDTFTVQTTMRYNTVSENLVHQPKALTLVSRMSEQPYTHTLQI